MVEKAPPVDWRALRDGDTIAKPTQPRPRFLERRSTSEGDMRRGSFRPSVYDDHFTQAIANDDGTPITANIEVLLQQLIIETQGIRALLLQLLGEVIAEGAETLAKGR